MNHYEPTRSSTNKRLWTIRCITDDGPNIVHGFTRFTSKRKAQEFCDRMNAAISSKTYEIVHIVDDTGLSSFFPDPSIREGDIEKDGYPVGTIRVEYDHAENCTTIVMADGIYTVDIDGYGYDVERGEFCIDRDGVHFRADNPERF